MGIEQKQSSVTKRRQFIKKAGAGVAVSSLPMKSVWGACSVSGTMSGNLSQTGGGNAGQCDAMPILQGGRSPGSWFNGNTWEPGSNGNAPASVFPQLRVGIPSNDKCLLDARIEKMRAIVNQFIDNTHLTLSESAAKYIFGSDISYSTSVSIRDAISILKIPIIEVHISNIYRREEFRQKSLISDVVTGGIFGIGSQCYILAINAMHEILKNGN